MLPATVHRHEVSAGQRKLVELEDKRIELEAGECLIMLPGVPYRFANLSDGPVRAISTVAPAGIEKMFATQR